MQPRGLSSDQAIARALGVSDKTVAKAIELRTKHGGPTG
jgi:biotin operon repressor